MMMSVGIPRILPPPMKLNESDKLETGTSFAQNQGQSPADGHGTQRDDERRNVAAGNDKSVECTKEQTGSQARQHRNNHRIGIRVGKRSRHHARNGHHGTNGQVDTARNDDKRDAKSQ